MELQGKYKTFGYVALAVCLVGAVGMFTLKDFYHVLGAGGVFTVGVIALLVIGFLTRKESGSG